MKCPHCDGIHSDTAKFCEVTGKAIEPQFQYCKNENCDYCNPLPLSAQFCPNCGKNMTGNNSHNAYDLNYQRPDKTVSRLAELINNLKNREYEEDELPALLNKASKIDTIAMDIDYKSFCEGRIIFNGIELGVTTIMEIADKGYLVIYWGGKDPFRIVIGNYELRANEEGIITKFKGLMPMFFYELGLDFGSSPKELYEVLDSEFNHWYVHEEYDEDYEFDEDNSYAWSSGVDLEEDKIIKLEAYIKQRDLQVSITINSAEIL